MRLIDADKLRADCDIYNAWDAKIVKAWLDDQPTIDAVPVVRCKDCRHWHLIEGDICGGNQYGSCDIVDCPNGEPPVETKEDDFCNYGERRNDE